MGKQSRKSRLLRQQVSNNNISKARSLDDLIALEQRISIEKNIVLNKALSGTDVNDLLKARNYLAETTKQNNDAPIKSMLVDPMDTASSFGYKDKPFQLSYDMLRAMAKTHIFKAIIATRKAQIQSFCVPQSNKYSSTGFIVDKRNRWSANYKDKKLTKEEQKKAEYITNFILNCGDDKNFWKGDTMERFVGKVIDDSLTLDQATFEIQRDRAKRPIAYYATDGGTYRIADTYNDDSKDRKDVEFIDGYPPFYVQLYQGKVAAQFWAWELCFGVRNPSTDIRTNGYGKSELEDLISLITAILNVDAYNANFFKVGSSPQGILTYSGNVNQNTLNDFRNSWMSMVSGVANAHKIPLINADKINFIPTHVPNREMEYAKFQEFLIKCGCAVYTIDPSEIGFPMSGNSNGSNGLGGDSTKEKLEYSKDKGLRPILKNLQYWFNKYIVWQIDPEFELRFVGDDDYEDKATELDNDIKKVGAYMTLNEIREKNDLDALDGGDIVLNPIAMQAQQMQMMGDPESNAAVDGMQDEKDNNPNPFMKSLENDLKRLLEV
jgi:hypothetical protein